MLLVRQGKEVRDDKGNILGGSGALLEHDAPIRESDRSKVIEVDRLDPDSLDDVQTPGADDF